MEKYLRHEPQLKRPPSCKRSRLSKASKAVINSMAAGCKSPSVDDILAFNPHSSVYSVSFKTSDEELSDDAEDR